MLMQIKIGDREIVMDSVITVDIGKTGGAYSVDFAEFGDEFIRHWLVYGVKQNLNDAAAPVKSDDPDVKNKALALIDKRVDSFRNGVLRTHEGGGRTVDPVRAEAIENAERYVREQWKKKSKKIGDGKEIRAEAIALVEKYPFYMTRAKEAIAERAEMMEAALADEE